MRLAPFGVLAALTIAVVGCGCGSTAATSSGSNGAAPSTVPATVQASTNSRSAATTQGTAPITRASLVSCLHRAGTPARKTPEIGFAPPGGALLVGRDGTGFIVGVFPDASYAKANAQTVASIAAAYVGKPDAEKNTHVVGTVVWFPQHSPFTGQHSAALDKCLAA